MKRNLLKVIGISFLLFVLLSWIIPVGTYSGKLLSTSGIAPIGLGDLFNKPISAIITFALYGVVFAVIGGFYGVAEESGALDKVVNKVTSCFEEKSTASIMGNVLKYVTFISGVSIVISYVFLTIISFANYTNKFDFFQLVKILFNFDRFIGSFIMGVILFASLLAMTIITVGSTAFVRKNDRFLVLTIVLFILLSSLTGLIIPLFVLVPLFAAVLFKLNYDKITVLASTVGSLLLGSVASTYGFNITGYTKNILSLESMNDQIVSKIILLILLTILFIVWTIRNSKQETKKSIVKDVKKTEKVKEVKKTVKNTKKTVSKKANTKKTTRKGNTKSLAVIPDMIKVKKNDHIKGTGFVVLFVLMLIVAFLGMYNWYYSFGVDVFTKAHEAVMGVKIGKFPIFELLLSGVSQFGYWSNVEFAGLLVVTSILIAFVYKMSVSDYIESFIAGMKKWLPTAFYATLASVILVVLYSALQSGEGTIVNTIDAKIFDLNNGFNPIITAVASFISSFFFNDLYYLLATVSQFISGYKGADLSVAGLLVQSFYSIAMMIFPTSVLLISGLSIFDVSYKDWIKYIWKFILITMLIVLIVCSIAIM